MEYTDKQLYEMVKPTRIKKEKKNYWWILFFSIFGILICGWAAKKIFSES